MSDMCGYVYDNRGGQDVGKATFHADTPEHAAMLEWLAFHGIDANRVPWGSTVERDVPGRCIRYRRVAEDDGGHIALTADGEFQIVEAVEQGEAPPLPFPEILRARMTEPTR